MKNKTGWLFLMLACLTGCGSFPASAQNILGKHPSDKFVPGFWNQHTNADSVIVGINLYGSSVFDLESPAFAAIKARIDEGGGGGAVTSGFSGSVTNRAPTITVISTNTTPAIAVSGAVEPGVNGNYFATGNIIGTKDSWTNEFESLISYDPTDQVEVWTLQTTNSVSYVSDYMTASFGDTPADATWSGITVSSASVTTVVSSVTEILNIAVFTNGICSTQSTTQSVTVTPVAEPEAAIVPYRTNIVAWSDTFDNLNNWRKIAPDSSFTLVGGKVRLGNYMDYVHGYGNYLVATNWTSALKNVCVTFDVTPVTQSAIGFGWYFEDDRATHDDTVLLFSIGTSIGVGEKANTEVYYGRTNLMNKIADASMKLFPFSVGDSLHVRLTRRETIQEVYVTNSTTGGELLYTFQTAINPAQYADGIPYDLKNASFCLWSVSGTNDVDNVVFNLQPMWPVDTLLLGDSITSGMMAENAEDSYASLLRRSLGPTVCNMGAPGSTVGSITRLLPEINTLSPSNVVLMVGGNDIGSGDAIAAVKSGYASLSSQITKRGTLFHCLPIPWGGLGAMTNMVEFICTNYPSSTWIDLYHPFLKNNTTDPLSSFYYTGDVIHPNAAGSAIIYRQIYHKLTGE